MLLLTILNPAFVYAQDDTTATKEHKQVEQETENDSAEKSEPEIVTPDRVEVTEQFSKDIPADFPVDI